MSCIFLVSDTHFGHERMASVFQNPDGSPVRGFKDADAMDEHMIARWNSVVRPQDKIYHLGDVAMGQQQIDRVMPRLNGHKRLVGGNHDTMQTKQYMRYFEAIYGVRVLDHMVLTHIPIAPWSMERFRANIHGHVHSNYPKIYGVGSPNDDESMKINVYVNLSVERIEYTPVSLEEVAKWVKDFHDLHTLIQPSN